MSQDQLREAQSLLSHAKADGDDGSDVSECGIFTEGIRLPYKDSWWSQQIEVHAATKEQAVQLRDAVLAAITKPEQANGGDLVFLVATGEVYEGQETYTRHDIRPPMCDAEVLYTHPATEASVSDEQIAACVKRASTYGLPFVGLLNPGGTPSDFSKRFTAEILALRPAKAGDRLDAVMPHIHDLYAELGIRWGDNPFPVIGRLRAAQAGVPDDIVKAAQDVVSAFSAALTEMESSLGDMVRESNCEGGTQFDTVRGYKALWAAQVELENLRAALAAQPSEPVAQVELITAGGNAGIATRIVEIDSPNRERLRYGTKLYTYPSAPGVPDDVVRDAERWRVSELLSEAALKHPDSRTEAENTAFNAYRAAFSSGNSYASCIDAAMLAAAPKEGGAA